MKNIFACLLTFSLMLFSFGCIKSPESITPKMDNSSVDPRTSNALPEFDPDFSRAFSICNNGTIAGSVRQNGTVVAFKHKNNQTWFSDEEVASPGRPEVNFCVNERGDVAGHKLVPGGVAPMVWLDGVGYELEPAAGELYGEVWDINNSGLMVGTSFSSNYLLPTGERATIFSLEGGAIDIGTLGGPEAGAAAVNDAGDIVGYADLASGEGHAFLYRNGVMEDLGTLGGTISNANEINNNGVIVGRSTLANGAIRGFIYKDGIMYGLGTLGGASSVAFDVNEDGDVVGFSRISNGQARAFLYKDGVMQNLGALGGTDSRAISINNKGEIVGHYTKTDGTVHGFFWKDGVMYPL